MSAMKRSKQVLRPVKTGVKTALFQHLLKTGVNLSQHLLKTGVETECLIQQCLNVDPQPLPIPTELSIFLGDNRPSQVFPLAVPPL